MSSDKNDWRSRVNAMMTDPNFAARATTAVDNTRKLNIDLMKKSAEDYPTLSVGRQSKQPLDLARVPEMRTEQAARATMSDDDSGVADLAVQAYADARKQIGDEVSKQMADDKSMAFVHPVAAGIIRSAESMKAGDVQKTFDRMLENNAVRQAIETKANKELTAALGKNPALTEEQQKDIYNKSVQRQIDAISNKVNQYLLDVNAPKSEGEYVLKSAVGNSLIGKSMLQAARNISGTESAEYDYAQQALADYDANKASWYAKGGAAIGGLLLDAPMMQGIGSASSAVLGRGTSMALGKAASNTLWGKMLIGQATAAGTLGGYNFTSTLASQMMGGHFDAGELIGSTLHGVGLGALTGGMTPLLRGATAGMGAVGKTATMGGGILGEAAAFSAPEWVETFNENPYDFKAYAEALGTNVMVIAGLKASNLPKTVQEYKEWWNQGKTSGFTDADYKALSDYALAKGYAADGAFTYQDGVYQRSMADRATGGRNILTMTKLEGGKERNLAMEMYQDPNVPLSMKTKIAAKMGLPAPNPVLPNAVEARDNVVNTYYEYREQMSDGTYVTRRILVDSKEMPSKRKARATASEFGRTKARQNSIIQSEAEANTDATNAIVMARLTEQAWRSGTNVSDEVARMYDIAQRAQRGEASAEDIAYYQSVMEGTTEVTDRIKADIKDKTGVDIDEVLKQEGTFNTAQDKALTMYSEALASLKDNSKPTTERGTTASQASIADYIELKGMGIEQTKQLLNDPTAKVAAEKEIRNKYALWLKYFDGQMSEEQLASRLGYNLDSTNGLMDFVNEEAFFRGKAANRIAYNAANAAKRLLEQGSGGVRFTEDGKVKLQGVPYSIAVDESIVDRYRAAQQGSGEPMQRIANDALKDIIRQSEQPIEEMLKQMTTEEQTIANEPQTEQEAVTQQMVDNRLAEIDTDLQGIEADGIQRVNINDKPAMIVKGRIATLGNGEIDRAKSSTEVAYIPLDKNGRPIKNEQGKPVVEVGVKPSNVRISEVEPWRTIEDYKRAEEQRIRDNNRITDEAMAQVDAEDAEVKEEMPTLDKVIVEPKDADELIAMCDGDKALALDVAVDELAKAQAAKGKGASTAETIDINRRIRTYQQIVDRLSASEMPDAAAADVKSEQKGEATKAEPQVTEDMEFIYQQGLDENHEGMEPMRMSDGRYKWVGLQRGELTATMGERDVELLDGLAKKLGVAVIPINVADSAVNGYYRDGNVYVNTNRGAEWTMRWVAGHELLHDVAKKSPEAYDAYKQAVLDMWGSDYINDQVKQIIDDYAASGKTIDREQALTELVNDFGGELFNSRDGLNILDNILKSESRKGNTGFVNTIKQWWEKLKEFFGVTPYASEVEKKLADAYKSAMKVMADRMGKRKVLEQQELATIGGLKDEAVADDAINNEGAEMSIVRDRNKIEELENEELVPMFRTFQILDGALYSPMATIQRGKKVHSVVEGDWWKSDENPDLAKVKVKGKKDEFYDKDDDRISKKDGQWVITIDGEDKPLATNGNSLSYYFNLKKGEKGDVVTDDLDVSYNPYIHSSKSALNDQFKGAYLRPNLVLVEVLVPKSELDGTNRYKADYAKDGIGEVDWNSGTVIKQAVAAGHPGRKVALSRYAKIGKVFTNAEWAKKIDEELSAYKGQITLPFIAFPPDVLRELANMGYKVEPPTSKKAQPYYEAWLKGEEPTDSNGGGEPTEEFSIKADKEKQLGIINRTNPAPDDYHTWVRTIDDIKTLQEAVDEVRAEDPEYNLSSYPDVTDDMINEALKSGKVTVYSSYPIKEGVFVSPSKMQAKDYAGGGRVYSKQVPINNVAWINTDEGMFAPTSYSVKGKQADESVLDYAKRMSEETGKKNLLNGGSYFSGGGLLEEGLKGIVNPTIAVEFNQKVAGVYRNNFGEHIVTADVRNVDPASLVKNIDGPVAYFHASPVCKNFSKAKQSAEELPLDKATAQSTAEFISKVRPKIVTIENVKGYRDSESMKIILDELKKQGYNYDVDVYNAADYGAYTSRERLIVRAVRDWSLPAKPMVMLADDRPSGWLEAVADIIDTLPEKKGGVAKWMDERLMAMGIDYRNIDKPLYVFGSGYSKDRIGYAFADELVPTLRTKGGDVIVMPDGRVLKATPRVLARISGMSDEYEMPKTDDLAHTIVGNGIPVQLTKAVMGSLIENVKSDLDAGNTEYSIIGKRGAANLDKRDETSIRVDNMVTAEEMEKAGKDAKTIRMATGWERGADNKWRYEVKDLSMLPAEQWIGKRNKKLSDIVENADELFAAYPELAKVKIKEGNGKTYGGSYSSGVITLDTYLAKLWMKRLPDSLPRANKYMNEALIHEIQHYIQEEEGFARGGNESMVLDKDAVSKISALIDDSNKLATQYNNMIERGVYEGREAVKDEIIALRAKANAIRNSNRLGSYGYKSLAGEVEARNVEKRLRMTEEERKKSLLADTEDVGRDEQIVYGNTDDEYSIKIRGKEYRNDGYTQREGVNLSIGANEALKSGMTDIGMDGLFGDFIAEKGLGKFDGEYHHVGQKFNKHYFAKLNDGVTLASARKAYKKYLEDKSNKEVADVLKKYPDAIAMDGGIYRDYKEVAYAGGKFWFVPRGENEPRPTIYRELPQGEDAQFSIKGGNTQERRTDEVARLKQKIEQLSQEKDAIAEDGAKVKDIASEMTNFIKQNISTEVQSDMTRNQFKGILNQLENAVTKKDLEKPMQMVEYIGTNVTRRSLTRQMRTFLKSEFKSMTPQGAVKAKTVDGATSRVLELAKTMYATMNKLPLGGEVAALQKQMRDLKAAAIEWANDQSADTKNLLADVLKTTERPAATRYSELAELRDKVAADGSASGEMLGYIDHMLDIMGDIDYFRGEQQKAKEASALNSKEDLEALKSELLDKSDKGILSEEDKAVLDNMPLYEMMVNLRQQQLDIDGGGAASIDAQIRNKQNAIKAYRAKMNELPKTNTTGRERYKALIEQVGGEIDDLFASRIVDQKAVNNGMRELIDDLVTLKEQGHSRLVEWSKGKQERSNGIRKLANDSFSSTARGYWDEVNKKGHRLRDINNFLNNAKLIMISPALSFEYMLGTLDKKYYTNDSPIYNRFIKSQDGLLKANDNFFEGLEAYNKEVNAAANRLIGRGAITNMAEWFKKGDRFATEEIPFAFEVDQMFDDGKVRKVTKGITATMTRGQAAKIYAWSRMTDGMAKLKAHGVTDETIAAVKDFIGEGYMRFVDWVEDDFFPRLRREKYNPKYKEIYGISMAENEHYFPFAIYKKDVRTNTDLEQIGDDKLGGGLVGNLIERKRNNARLDFTRKSPDIFDMITRYGETMEEWAAYAQVREDLKAMVNDKQFKVKCDMFGTDYYKHFLEAARVASRTSDDKALAGKWNTSMGKLQKVLASSAISMRVSTALKQLLSAPAFAVYSLDPKFVHQLEKTVVPIDVESAIKGLWKIGSGDLAEAKKLLLNENWVGHYNWCVNNLPSFRERVSLGGAGNPILEEKGFDTFFGKLCDAVQSAGMIPNRLVDAFTCSVGAKAVYEYNFNKYKKMYGEKTAHNMAVTEAEIAFNSSQQSSNPVFLSPMQVTKQFFVRGLMNFKNSPIGYLRAGLKANTDIVRAIKSIYNPTFKVDGQEMRFNSNGKNAASMLMTAAARSAMYNFFLNFIWNLGTVGIAGLSYTAMRNLSGEGNEDGNLLYTDEEWKKATGDNLAGTLFLCATQGIPYISGPFATAEQGTEFAPLMLLNTLNEMGTDIYQSGLVSPVTAQWITNLALKNGAGIDPQVCAQVYEGLQGILADRPVTEEDIMNLLASPRSAISGMTKQKVGEFDRMRDYVDARIKSNREIGIDERMDFGKALAGKRELRKSNLDYYIDEYLEANIPGYREISGRKSKETKQEEQANKKLYEQSMSLVEKIVGNPKGEADEQKASKIDSEDYDTKYKVRRLRDAVAAIHKLYAAGDYGTAEDIAEEMRRRIERGYDPNGKTLDERLKNVDIWEPAGEVKQDSPDGYYTNFDRAIGGEFKKMYVGKMNSEGN